MEGNATAPEVLQERAAAYCPVEVMAFERRQDFPRVFHVLRLRGAELCTDFWTAGAWGNTLFSASSSPSFSFIDIGQTGLRCGAMLLPGRRMRCM